MAKSCFAWREISHNYDEKSVTRFANVYVYVISGVHKYIFSKQTNAKQLSKCKTIRQINTYKYIQVSQSVSEFEVAKVKTTQRYLVNNCLIKG